MRALDGRRLSASDDFADLCLADGWLLGDQLREAMEPSLSGSTALNSMECLPALSVVPRSRWSVGTQSHSGTSGRASRWTVLSARLCGELFVDSEALWPSGWRAYLSADMSAGSATRTRARACAAACSVARSEERTCPCSRFASGAVQLRSTSRPARTAVNLPEYLPEGLPGSLPDLLPQVRPNDLSNKLPDMLPGSLPDRRPVATWKPHYAAMASRRSKQMWATLSVRPGRYWLAGHRTSPFIGSGTAPHVKGWSKLWSCARTVWRNTGRMVAPTSIVSRTQRCSRTGYQGMLWARLLKVFAAPGYIKQLSILLTTQRAAACADEPCDFGAARSRSSRARLYRLPCRILRKQVQNAT
jgi:hypothetical protein